MNKFRKQRDLALAATDFAMMSDYPIAEDKLELLITYRQTLRDLPEMNADSSDPMSITIPPMPELK